MRWYNLETEDMQLRDKLREYLKRNGIRYELSECGTGVHFEVYCDARDQKLINDYIDTLQN